MLPQPDPHVLESNPQFAALYKDLEATKLEANGRARVGLGVPDKVALKERGEFEERLHKARVEEAKREILRDTLGAVGYRGDGSLPDELFQTIQITSAQLAGKISLQDRTIADPELTHFLSQIHIITPALCTHLHETHTLLTCLADPTSRTNTNLSTTLSTLQTSITESRTTLSNQRTATAKKSAELLLSYTKLYETSIKLLEQTLHGSISRHTRAQATYLALVAQGIEKKILILKKQVLGQVYTADVRGKLQREIEDVEGEIRVGRGRLGRREGALGQLEGVGRGLEKCAEDVKALRGEIEKTREEVERLEGV